MTEVNDKELIQVRNLTDHSVGFIDSDTHRRIVFNAYEIKKLPAEILRRLFFSHGGVIMLRNYLNVGNKELAAEFGVSNDTIEYDWTRQDVERVLENGSLDELEDALDFGPEGIIDLIVNTAVELESTDTRKRKAIMEHTGFDISKMIELKNVYIKDRNETEEQPKVRRATPAKTTGRRVEATKE